MVSKATTRQSAKHFSHSSSLRSKAASLRSLLRSQKAKAVGVGTRIGRISEKIRGNRVKTTKSQRMPSRPLVRMTMVTSQQTKTNPRSDKGSKLFAPNQSPHRTKRVTSRKLPTRRTYVCSSSERPLRGLARLPVPLIFESSSTPKEPSMRRVKDPHQHLQTTTLSSICAPT